MDAISGYGSGDDEVPLPVTLLPRPASVNAAPSALTLTSSERDNRLSAIDTKNNSLTVNRRVDVVLAPTQGPANPFRFNAGIQGVQRVGLGSVEATSMEDWCFDEQYHTYQKSGYAVDSETNAVIGDYEQYLANGGNSASYRRKTTGRFKFLRIVYLMYRIEKAHEKRKRDPIPIESLVDDSSGPWATLEKPKDPYQIALEAFQANATLPPAVVPQKPVELAEEKEEVVVKNPRLHILEPEAEDEVWEKKNERQMGFVLPPRPARGATIAEVLYTHLKPRPILMVL